jgi:hypothetical protein
VIFENRVTAVESLNCLVFHIDYSLLALRGKEAEREGGFADKSTNPLNLIIV